MVKLNVSGNGVIGTGSIDEEGDLIFTINSLYYFNINMSCITCQSSSSPSFLCVFFLSYKQTVLSEIFQQFPFSWEICLFSWNKSSRMWISDPTHLSPLCHVTNTPEYTQGTLHIQSFTSTKIQSMKRPRNI